MGFSHRVMETAWLHRNGYKINAIGHEKGFRRHRQGHENPPGATVNHRALYLLNTKNKKGRANLTDPAFRFEINS
jgi:hypothetical protein